MRIGAESCRTIGISAWCLVVPVQNPNVLVYLQLVALFLYCMRRQACSATSSPRPARYVKRDPNVVLRSWHEPEYNVLNKVVIEKATYA
jgi:hypothetical protein